MFEFFINAAWSTMSNAFEKSISKSRAMCERSSARRAEYVALSSEDGVLTRMAGAKAELLILQGVGLFEMHGYPATHNTLIDF